MIDRGDAYAEVKARVLDLVGSPDSGSWGTAVPATPAWKVREVVAHVTGIAADAAAGTIPDGINLLEQFRDPDVVAARNEFADGHVARREGRTPADLLEEWGKTEPSLLDLLRGTPRDGASTLPLGFDSVIVTDLCVHADDIAHALGASPTGDAAAVRLALAGYAFGVDYRVRALGLPALVLRYDGKEKVLGEGEPAATLSAERWELLRVLAGRRSREQIAALDWTGDPEPYLPLLPAYGERDDALIEGGDSE